MEEGSRRESARGSVSIRESSLREPSLRGTSLRDTALRENFLRESSRDTAARGRWGTVHKVCQRPKDGRAGLPNVDKTLTKGVRGVSKPEVQMEAKMSVLGGRFPGLCIACHVGTPKN